MGVVFRDGGLTCNTYRIDKKIFRAGISGSVLLANRKSSRDVVMSVILIRHDPLEFLQQTISGSPTIVPVAIVGQLIIYCPTAHYPGRPEIASQE